MERSKPEYTISKYVLVRPTFWLSESPDWKIQLIQPVVRITNVLYIICYMAVIS